MHNGEKIYTLCVRHFFLQGVESTCTSTDAVVFQCVRVFFRGPIQCVCRSIALLFLLKATKVHPKSQFHICFMTYTLFLVVFCLFSMRRVTCVQNFIPSFYSVTSVLLVICCDWTRPGRESITRICLLCLRRSSRQRTNGRSSAARRPSAVKSGHRQGRRLSRP